jgi:hypothetical protein
VAREAPAFVRLNIPDNFGRQHISLDVSITSPLIFVRRSIELWFELLRHVAHSVSLFSLPFNNERSHVNHESLKLNITYRQVDDLRPYTQNARTHTKHQLRQIAESIRVFGFTNPILIDKKNTIIAGHGRVEAAKTLGMSQVPTIRLENLNQDQIRAYIIADNKLAENAGWDKSILAIELQNLLTLDCADFDVTITGFEVPEIDIILEEAQESSAALETIPEPDLNQLAVTQPGDSPPRTHSELRLGFRGACGVDRCATPLLSVPIGTPAGQGHKRPR